MLLVVSRDYVWSDDLPDACPPADAQPGEGTYFRLLRGNAPTPRDWVRPRDMPKHSGLTNWSLCKASAYSIYRDFSDLDALRAAVPGMRKWLTAQGELRPDMGVTTPTPVNGNSHTSWWVAVGHDPTPVFSIVPP